MADFKTQLNIINTERANFDKQERALYSLRLKQQRGENVTVANLKAAKDQLATAKTSLQTQIGVLVQGQTNDALVVNWEADVPLFLLPLRIQTRIIMSGLGFDLLVRVYPDDFYASSHEDTLTDGEVEAGKDYWDKIRLAEKLTGTAVLDVKKEAWLQISAQFGGSRALYIVRVTIPTNRTDLKNLSAKTDMKFNIAAWAETKNVTWSQAAKTRLLPERFQVIVTSAMAGVTQPIVTKDGNLIPDTLQLGLDPFNEDGNFQKNKGEITTGAEIKWLTDFAEAERMGMGIRVPLPPAFFPVGLPPQTALTHLGIKSVAVVGVLASADKIQSAALLQKTFDNHTYSPKGLAFLQKGTPTNNTDDSDSAFSVSDDSLSMGFFDGQKPFSDNDQTTDGARLSIALGIPKATFQNVPNAEKRDVEHNQQVNIALYNATIGYYCQELLGGLGINHTELQDFFQRFVIGGGHCPALRVGNQPYGIVLTSLYQNIGKRDANPFYTALTRIIGSLETEFQNLVSLTPRVGFGTNPSQTLVDILSLHAQSVAFNQQWFLPDDNRVSTKYTPYNTKLSENNSLISNYLRQLGATNPTNTVLGRLVNYPNDPNTMLSNDNLIKQTDFNLTETVANAENFNYLKWLATDIKNIRELETMPFGSRTDMSALLLLMVRQSFLRLFMSALEQLASLPLFKNEAEQTKAAIEVSNPLGKFRNVAAFNIDRVSANKTVWEVSQIAVKLNDADGSPTKTIPVEFSTRPLSELLLTAVELDKILNFYKDTTNTSIQNTIRPIQQFANLRLTLKYLSLVPAANLERTLVSHLDTVSYRLDAWQEGLIARKLEQQRKVKPTGIYIGAYGWVEDLKLGGSTTNTEGGFIHAPSPTHATAAAVMKSAFLNHLQPKGSAFALNLSSQRLQRAQQVLELMRGGERLEAILGYQFERELTDASIKKGSTAAAFIPAFREKFPIMSRQMPINPAETAKDVISNQNVVNGLNLAETKPHIFPIIIPPNSPTNEAALRVAQIAFINLNDTIDAIKDLLAAETAYRMAQGNFASLGATLDKLNKGELPHDLGFIQPTRATLFQFSNRVALHFSTDAPNLAFSDSPRARTEAGLNQWCGQLLGDFTKIGFAVRQILSGEIRRIEAIPPVFFTLNQLDIQPIDFVCLSANPSELEARMVLVFRKTLNISDDILVKLSFTETKTVSIQTLDKVLPTARLMHRIITAARPLTAEDYLPDGTETPPSVIDAPGFRARIDLIINDLDRILISIKNINLSQTLILSDTNDQLTTMNDVFLALKKIKLEIPIEEALPRAFSDATTLHNLLIQLSSFGIAESYPRFADPKNPRSIVALVRQAAIVVETTDKLLVELNAELAKLPDATTEQLNHAENLWAIGKKAFSGTMPILPRFKYTDVTDIAAANSRRAELLKGVPTDPTPPEMKAEEWLQSVARVRPKLAQLETLRFMTATSPLSLDLQPIQIPLDALVQKQADGSEQPIYTWAAVEFTEGVRLRRNLVSVVCIGEAAAKTDKLQTGLLIDDFTEVIPSDDELTALTFHYNQPNTEAPQAMLLAVCPDEKWTWATVVSSVTETFRRAKLRTVDISTIKEEADKKTVQAAPNLKAIAQMLPMLIAPVNIQQHTPSLDFGMVKKEERDRMNDAVKLKTEEIGHYQIWQE